MSFLSDELRRWKNGEIECGSSDMAIYARRIVAEEKTRNAMKINITPNIPPPIPGHEAYAWQASFDDYDGAPDATWNERLHAFGQTKREAVTNLLEQAELGEDENRIAACREWLWLQA